jgi:hypothetical protein
MYDSDTRWGLLFIFSVQPIPHGSHQIGDDGEGRWVVIGPWEMVYSVVNVLIWVASPFSPKLKDGPFFFMFLVKKSDEVIDRISIGLFVPY